MKKVTLPMMVAISASLITALSKDKEGNAKKIIDEAETSFLADLQKELKLLKAKKSILEQKISEHSFNPPKSRIMELELAVETAKNNLADAFEDAKTQFVSNLVNQALAGTVAKESFKLLYRLQKKDVTLAPIAPFERSLRIATDALKTIVTDATIEGYNAEIAQINEEIELIDSMLLEK